MPLTTSSSKNYTYVFSKSYSKSSLTLTALVVALEDGVSGDALSFASPSAHVSLDHIGDAALLGGAV